MASPETQEPEPRRPPYLPWTTLVNFVQRLNATVIPPHIDKSLMSNLSGAVQGHLISAMKFLGLIEGNDNRVTDRLRKLVEAHADATLWKSAVLSELMPAYSPVEKSLHVTAGTASQLRDAFEKTWNVDGEVREKSIRFYLAMLDAAGVTYSPHFKQRPASVLQPRRKARANGGKDTAGAHAPPAVTPKIEQGTTPEMIPDGFVAHPFRLRADLNVTLVLPGDLTIADVERLNRWLVTLPLA